MKDWTLEMIIKLVDLSKDLKSIEQTNIAISLPITVCSLYVINMKERHGITINI